VAEYEDDPYDPRNTLRPKAQERTEHPYFYSGTEVLRNKLDIRSDQDLLRAESLFGWAREQELRSDPQRITGALGFGRLKAIHQHLFQDLYDWAGEIRTVNIGKDTSWFTRSDSIERRAGEIFALLKSENYLKGLDPETFSERAAHYYDQLNALHPFREGNGRALRVFMHDLAHEAGYRLDLTKADRDAHLKAAASAFNGDRRPLAQLFERLVVTERNQAAQLPNRETTVGTRLRALRRQAEHYKGPER
jgi:cell filamentation protein